MTNQARLFATSPVAITAAAAWSLAGLPGELTDQLGPLQGEVRARSLPRPRGKAKTCV